VLLVGGGGREHALAWKLRQSKRLGKLWIAQSNENAALAQLGEVMPFPLDIRAPFHVQRWCDKNDIHLVVVGPEQPLADGIADVFATDTRRVFGPVKDGARIEADKAWAKDIMRSAAIPTADSRTFRSADAALEYVDSREDPVVIKASGLAAGKGVVVCDTRAMAEDAIERIMRNREFGEAGATVVIEEKLAGQEVSVLALTDGRSIWVLDPCQDHKQVKEGDTGPNTGGMGAYCPTPLLDEEMLATVERDILVPTVDALRREGVVYRGVLYAGLMLTHAGPKVLEFNCRFGDPECEALIARWRSDVLEALWATSAGTLNEVELEFDERTSCTVIMCSAGYPGPYEKGKVITGIDDANAMNDVIVFHAGTKRDASGNIVTNGGRVLAVTALGDDLRSARDRANEACAKIHFEGAHYRRDIGDRVLKREVVRSS
jgi:phosphoribosylamine--glycine ligase